MAKDGDLVDFVAHLLEKDPHKRLGGVAAAPAGERGEQAFGAFHPWIIAADAVYRHPWLRAGGQHDVRVTGGALPVRSALSLETVCRCRGNLHSKGQTTFLSSRPLMSRHPLPLRRRAAWLCVTMREYIMLVAGGLLICSCATTSQAVSKIRTHPRTLSTLTCQSVSRVALCTAWMD